MSIQQSINQSLTGATFLLQQTPLYQTMAARRKGKKQYELEVGLREAGSQSLGEDLVRVPEKGTLTEQSAALADVAARHAGNQRQAAENIKKMPGYEKEALEAGKKALEAESSARYTAEVAQRAAESEADLQETQRQYEEAQRSLAAAQQEDEHQNELLKQQFAMLRSMGGVQSEATIARQQSEEFRKRVFEGIYRKGERL